VRSTARKEGLLGHPLCPAGSCAQITPGNATTLRHMPQGSSICSCGRLILKQLHVRWHQAAHLKLIRVVFVDPFYLTGGFDGGFELPSEHGGGCGCGGSAYCGDSIQHISGILGRLIFGLCIGQSAGESCMSCVGLVRPSMMCVVGKGVGIEGSSLLGGTTITREPPAHLDC
jgi:hypothetical protein